MRKYAIVLALPLNPVFDFGLQENLTSTDIAVWYALNINAVWTGGGMNGVKQADDENDYMTGYCMADYKHLMRIACIKHKLTFYNSIKILERCGFVERKYHGPLKETEYILHVPK